MEMMCNGIDGVQHLQQKKKLPQFIIDGQLLGNANPSQR